jgi:S1-C subfamily serine protease
LRTGQPTPRTITVDKNAAHPKATKEMNKDDEAPASGATIVSNVLRPRLRLSVARLLCAGNDVRRDDKLPFATQMRRCDPGVWGAALPAIRPMPQSLGPVQSATMQGGNHRMDMIEQFSSGLADRIAAAAPFVVGIHTGRRPTSGILWRPDVVLASEQILPEDGSELRIVQGGQTVNATLAGRDPGTNVAVLKLATPLQGAVPPAADDIRVGHLTLLVGADTTGGATGRLAMIHSLGQAWHSMAGGRIDALIRLDTRLGQDEGGPVLSLTGGLIGMSTSGPRRRTLVIPTSTLDRVVDPLLTEGRIARGWLGVGLQPVQIPDSFRQIAERETGLMVVGLASGGPAETAGVLPGDIVLDIDGAAIGRPRALTASLTPDRIGQPAALRLLRAGAVQTISVTIAARPAT